MSFWPAGYDPRAEIIGVLDLVAIDAPSGPARFMVGQEGRFRDAAGNHWWGSQLVSADPLEWSRDGTAPAGALTLSYFQDPAAPELIDELRESGDDVLRGRKVEFFVQPLGRVEDFYAPQHMPVLVATRTAGALRFSAEGDVVRHLQLSIEGSMAPRRAARGLYYTVADHEALIGETNPSLTYMPTDARQEETLFG